MTRDLERQLLERFPALFLDLWGNPRVTGLTRIELPDEWFPLLERLCEALAPYHLHFSQLKVKFGELRVYYRTEQERKPIDEVVARFEAESRQEQWQQALSDSLANIARRVNRQSA